MSVIRRYIFPFLFAVVALALAMDNFWFRKADRDVKHIIWAMLDTVKSQNNRLGVADSALESERLNHWFDTVDGYPPPRSAGMRGK